MYLHHECLYCVNIKVYVCLRNANNCTFYGTKWSTNGDYSTTSLQLCHAFCIPGPIQSLHARAREGIWMQISLGPTCNTEVKHPSYPYDTWCYPPTRPKTNSDFAPENRPKPKRKRSSSNHPFSGDMLDPRRVSLRFAPCLSQYLEPPTFQPTGDSTIPAGI